MYEKTTTRCTSAAYETAAYEKLSIEVPALPAREIYMLGDERARGRVRERYPREGFPEVPTPR